MQGSSHRMKGKKINFLELSDTGILNIDCHQVSMLHYVGRMRAVYTVGWGARLKSTPVLNVYNLIQRPVAMFSPCLA